MAPVGGDVARLTFPEQVKQTRSTLCELLREIDPPAAESVMRTVQQRPATPSIAVIGETNRGKSSLVNALLDQPCLSPVDTESSTATYLVFEHGPQWTARARVADETVEIEVSELRDWVRAVPREGSGFAHSVRVEAPLDALDGLTVVDTPGVGGLDSWNGERVLTAAAEATALLFVLDASAPLGRAELDFLRRAANQVETVVFALTRIDQQRDWQRILAADRELLAEHAPRFAQAPMFPVSARMHELAASAPTEQAALLREQDGVGALRSALRQLVTGRRLMLSEANTLRALSTVLDGVSARLAGEMRVLTAAGTEAESLRARRDELTARRRSAGRGWQLRLRGEIQRIKVELGHEVARQCRQVQDWFRDTLVGSHPWQSAELPHQVDQALRTVSARITAMLSARLTAVAEGALDELFSEEERAVLYSQLLRGHRGPVLSRPPRKRSASAEDRLVVFMGISSGLGVGRAAVLPLAGLGVAAFSPLVVPATIVLGLGAGWWIARTRRHLADKQHLKQWLTETITEARSVLEQLVSEQLIEAEQRLSLAVDDAVARRIDAVNRQLLEVDRALRMNTAERARTMRVTQRRIDEVEAGQQRVQRLLRGIRRLRDGIR
jgi:hypothetical protein